jgi:endonuclease/exonuclease/phosphatase family metal-dependent hydrolase
MSARAISELIEKSAPRILGALFCLAIPLLGGACKKSSTPDWDSPGGSVPAAKKEVAFDSFPQSLPPSAPGSTPQPAVEPPQASDAVTSAAMDHGLRFMAYNVQNWLTMDRYVDRKPLKGAPKPATERQAVVTIVSRHRPDVIGLCEIGTAGDLAEIQDLLKSAGLNLPHSHYVGGSDPTRHLGFLSRFPIKSTAKPAESEYRLAGRSFAINRGILDATIEARGKRYRFLGVHLKSKRESEEADQEAIRLNEARLLRRHVDSILKIDPQLPLVVYGDFNDTRSSPGLKMITGTYNDPTYLTAIPAKDSNQELWTHYWELNDIYSRFDFVMVSQALKKQVDFPASKIINDAEWNDASDHRPVLAIFK